ncbi:MAG: hypothetical protein IJA61_02520 [Clostridia bacterium]|nr:hypothetical protein [Clostridia bacterium]
MDIKINRKIQSNLDNIEYYKDRRNHFAGKAIKCGIALALSTALIFGAGKACFDADSKRENILSDYQAEPEYIELANANIISANSELAKGEISAEECFKKIEAFASNDNTAELLKVNRPEQYEKYQSFERKATIPAISTIIGLFSASASLLPTIFNISDTLESNKCLKKSKENAKKLSKNKEEEMEAEV